MSTPIDDFELANYHYSLTREDLGDEADLWYRRIHETLRALEYQYWIPRGNGKASVGNLHICPEFPDAPLEYPPNTIVEDRAPFCERNQTVPNWRTKDVSMFPPCYRDVCSYCTYRFIRWWSQCDRMDPLEDPRPDSALEIE